MEKIKILIMGATGMLGYTLFNDFAKNPKIDIAGTLRNSAEIHRYFPENLRSNLTPNVDANNFDSVTDVIGRVRPQIIINCIGLIKQLSIAREAIPSIEINALFPHRLANLCRAAGIRLIHISTDCVFNGSKGNYSEADPSDAQDLYGRTKFLGELAYPHCITLRTSIIGHELKSHVGLVEWFLAQNGDVRGYTRAIYTGFPTIELSRIIQEYIIPRPGLAGLYHLSSDPINKYELLKLIAEIYSKKIFIEPYEEIRIDRSLDSSIFRRNSGYEPPAWQEMIEKMHQDYMKSYDQKSWKQEKVNV